MLCELAVTWRGLIVMCCVSIMCVVLLRSEVLSLYGEVLSLCGYHVTCVDSPC